MRDDALARNEVLLREVNEQIDAVSLAIPAADPAMEFLCECDRVDCRKPVNATRAEYEAVRAEPTHFIVLPEHNDPRVEHVVSSNERFLVVEKEGEAARVAEESDPRDPP
jgi:hypothetical protein